MPVTEFTCQTRGPGLTEITRVVSNWLAQGSGGNGLLTLMIRHTSASLLIQENADPTARDDLANWFARFVPDADDPTMDWLTHVTEGPDDMPAHIKAAHLPVSLQIPVYQGQMTLGAWQGIYIVEHRARPHQRQVAAHFLAD